MLLKLTWQWLIRKKVTFNYYFFKMKTSIELNVDYVDFMHIYVRNKTLKLLHRLFFAYYNLYFLIIHNEINSSIRENYES